MVQLYKKHEEEANPANTGMISLSVDDLYPYSVAHTDVDSGGTHENIDIHDMLSEGTAKIVPHGMAGSDIDTLPHKEPIHIQKGMKVKQLTPVSNKSRRNYLSYK